MFYFEIDAKDLFRLEQNLQSAAESAMKKAANDLAVMGKAHIVEEAGKKLKSRREQFVKALSVHDIGNDTTLIVLDKKAAWIDSGEKPFSMVESLLKSKKVKTAADGSKYLNVPFNHSPGAGKTNSTTAQLDLISTIKSEFKKRNIQYAGIEKNPDGSAKQGLLHSVDIMGKPTKTSDGPGQGKGPVGAVRQGKTGTPFLQGVRVYQKDFVDPVDSKTKTKRSIMTFRTVSSKDLGTDKWMHPGLKPTNLMEEGFTWMCEQWEKLIVPQLLRDFNKSL